MVITKKNPILFCHFRRLVFDERSPVHPVSESRGGAVSVTHVRWTEILVSNIGLVGFVTR